MIKLKAIYAWWVTSLTHDTREFYNGLGNLCKARAFVGVNPFWIFLDAFAFIFFGLVCAAVLVAWLGWFIPGAIILVLFRRAEFQQLQELVKAYRIDWLTGTVVELQEGEKHGQGA